jgi:hypothetical protein
MKDFIKKLLREGLNDISGFDNITPEERKEIDRRYQDYMREDNESIVKYGVRLKQIYSSIEQIQNNPNLEQHIKDSVLKQVSNEIDVLKTSINTSKNRDKKAVYNEIARQYLSSKRYEDERFKARESKKFGKEDIINLFVDALEGGSNYWYHIKHLPEDVKYDIKQKGVSTSEAIGEHILNGGYVQFYDAEGDEYNDDDYLEKHSDKDLLGNVDMDSILDAIAIIKRDYPEVWESILDEQYDANDADIFLQLCVMGEVVFG